MSKHSNIYMHKKFYSVISNFSTSIFIIKMNWKNLKLMLFTVKSPPPNYNNRAKITNIINSNSNSFTNLINHSYFYLFIHSLIFENSLNLFLCLHLVIKSPPIYSTVGWGCRIHRLYLCREVKPHPNECPRYDTKQSDGKIPVMLDLWGMRSPSLLPSFLGPLWPRVVAPDKGPIYGLNRTKR